MKLINSILMMLCVSMMPLTASAQEELSEAVQFAKTMGVGWNLGNNLDCHVNGVSDEKGWGNPAATQKTFDAVKKAGFKSVRIPVTWLGHVGKAPEYHIEKAWMDRVAEVVGYAKKAGLKVILNIHHDGHADQGKADDYTWLDVAAAAKNEELNQQIKIRLTMMWMQIATRFQNEGDWLIFETLNEIHDGNWGNKEKMQNAEDQYRVLNEWNQTAVDIIRATGGNNETRFIGVPGYVCQPWLTMETMKLPNDPTPNRLMVAVHMYDPWEYAGSGKFSEWGHTADPKYADKAGEEEYVKTLDGLYNTYVKNGIPVYLGEYGCVHRNAERAENFRKYYIEYTCKALGDRHIPLLFWDNGYNKAGDDAFGLINHATGKSIANGLEISKIMVNAWNNPDPNYTLESVYEKAPR